MIGQQEPETTAIGLRESAKNPTYCRIPCKVGQGHARANLPTNESREPSSPVELYFILKKKPGGDWFERTGQRGANWVRMEPSLYEAFFRKGVSLLKATFATSDLFTQHSDNADDVREFCRRNGVVETAKAAVDLAKLCFSGIRRISLEVDNDPESGESWVAMTVFVRGNRGDALAAYRQYVSRWVKLIPWPQRYMVRVSYSTD